MTYIISKQNINNENYFTLPMAINYFIVAQTDETRLPRQHVYMCSRLNNYFNTYYKLIKKYYVLCLYREHRDDTARMYKMIYTHVKDDIYVYVLTYVLICLTLLSKLIFDTYLLYVFHIREKIYKKYKL